jgi:hypothetical protein
MACKSHGEKRGNVWVMPQSAEGTYTDSCWLFWTKECFIKYLYEGVSKSFRTGRLERELQMVQLSATRFTCIAILWVRLVSFAAITLCIASQRVFIVVVVVYFVITRSGNFWINPRILQSSTIWNSMCVSTMLSVTVSHRSSLFSTRVASGFF